MDNSDKRRINPLLMAAALGFAPKNKQIVPQPKPCLKCGKLHYHNNSFCSAECCKGYQKK